MKYPRLKDKDNLSRKLTDKQIAEIQHAFEKMIKTYKSMHAVREILTKRYKVSYSTVYYWTDSRYRKDKRAKNTEYWNKTKFTDPEKWYAHKKGELLNRRKRMERNPKLKLWHEVVGAKNEKRVKRRTVKGKLLKYYESKV